MHRAVVDHATHADGLEVAVFRTVGDAVVVGAVATAVDVGDARRALDEQVGGEVGPVTCVQQGAVAGRKGIGIRLSRCGIPAEVVHAAHAVVAREDRAVDLAAFNVEVAQAVERREVAAAVHVAVVVGQFVGRLGGAALGGQGRGRHVGLVVQQVGVVVPVGAAHGAVVHLEVHAAVLRASCGGQRCRHAVLVVAIAGTILESDVAHHTAAVGRVEDVATVDVEVRVVLRRRKHAHVLVVVVCRHVGVAVDVLFEVDAILVVVAVVVAVAAAVDVLQHQCVAVDDDPRAFAGHRRAYVAADVAAALHVAEHTARQAETRRVEHVGHTAAAVDVLHEDGRVRWGVHHRTEGARHLVLPAVAAQRAAHRVAEVKSLLVTEGYGFRRVETRGGSCQHGLGGVGRVGVALVVGAVVGRGVDHVALVAAAVDVLHAARGQVDVAQVGHVGLVVAAEEDAHVVAARLGDHGAGVGLQHLVASGLPVVLLAGIARVERAPGLEVHVVGVVRRAVAEFGVGEVKRRVVVDELVAAAVDGADGLYHRGLVATHEAGVRHAAQDAHLGMRALHHVAAAVEVADAEVAAVAREVGVLRVQLVGELGVVDGGVDVRTLRDGAAVVVAAEEGHDAAAVDVDGDGRRGRAGTVDADEGIFGTAEDGVQMQQVVVQGRCGGVDDACLFSHTDHHVGAFDVRHRAAAFLAFLAVLEVGACRVGGVAEAAGDDMGLVDRRVTGEGVLPGVDLARVVAVAEAVVAGAHRAGEGVGGGPGAGADVVGRAVAVVAAAAAVDVGDAHVVHRLQAAHLDGGRTLYPARDVVAAVDGVDGVGVVDGDLGIAARDVVGGGIVRLAGVIAHIGHAAAAAHIAQHHRRVHRVDVVALVEVVVEGDLLLDGVVDVVGDLVDEAVLHHGRQGGLVGGGHRVAVQRDGFALVGDGDGARGVVARDFLHLQHAAGRGVDAVGNLLEGQGVVDRRRRVRDDGAVLVVVGMGGGDAGRAEGLGAALAVVEVDAGAFGFLYVFDVRGPHRHRQGAAVAHDVDLGGRGLVVAQAGVAQGDAFQAVLRVGAGAVDDDAVHDLLHWQE